MNQVYAKLQNCYECVRKKTDFVPKVAIVLGSGLGDYAEQIRVVTEIPYAEIKGFPVSTVPGHAGKFIFGYLDEIPVVCMKIYFWMDRIRSGGVHEGKSTLLRRL